MLTFFIPAVGFGSAPGRLPEIGRKELRVLKCVHWSEPLSEWFFHKLYPPSGGLKIQYKGKAPQSNLCPIRVTSLNNETPKTTPMGLEPTIFATGKQRLTIRPRCRIEVIYVIMTNIKVQIEKQFFVSAFVLTLIEKQCVVSTNMWSIFLYKNLPSNG